MPWVGLIAPDWPGSVLPDDWAYAESAANGSGGVSVTINTSAVSHGGTSPIGITAGDLMMFTFVASAQFAAFTSRSIPASITLLTDVAGSNPCVVGYKIADANDEAGTASYTFSASNPGGLADGRATLVSWPATYGTTPASAQLDTSSPASTAPTGGADWYFVSGQIARSGASAQPLFTMTSAGDVLLSSTGANGGTSARNYKVENTVSPITGTYNDAGSVKGMSVIGITA